MAGHSDDIIDLCDSFTLANPPSYLRDICIVLDSDDSVLLDTEDSFAENGHPYFSPSSSTCYSASSVSSLRKQKAVNSRDLCKNGVKKPEETTKRKSKLISLKKQPTFGDCPICFDPLGQNPLASTKCGHVYCMKCIKQYLLFDTRCPTCRQKMNGKSSYHPLYLNKELN